MNGIPKIKLKGRRSDHRPGNGFFKPGWTKLITPEQNERRLMGLRKAWAHSSRKRAGEDIGMTIYQKKKKGKQAWLTEAKRHAEIQTRAQQYSWELGIEELAKMIKDPETPKNVKLGCIEAMLNRAFGKATQINANVEVGTNATDRELSRVELERQIRATLEEVKQLKQLATEGESAGPGTKQLTDLRKFN